MDNILLANTTKNNTDKFLEHPSHALLIVGAPGSGKYFLAKTLATEILKEDNLQKLEQNPYFISIIAEENSISIESIRDLKSFFRLKTTGNNEIRRLAIITDAQKMTDEAQNAILKLLEEPPSDTVIIMTADSERKLNQTILSRLQILRINKPDLSQSIDFFEGNFDKSNIKKNYALSDGAVGLMYNLLSNSEDNDLLKHIELAKQVLSSNRLDKLLFIESFGTNKIEISDKLFALKRVAHAALVSSIKLGKSELTNRWLNSLVQINKAELALNRGVNVKLLLTSLFANL